MKKIITKYISFNSQKGGVHKTTISQAVAVEATRAGVRTLLADCDPKQKTNLLWSKDREIANIQPLVECKSFKTIEEVFSSDLSDYSLVIIDAPALATIGTVLAAEKSNVMIQPCGSSSYELRPTSRLFRTLIDKHNVPNEKLFVVLTKIGNENEARNARQYFVNEAIEKEKEQLNVLENYLREKPSYRKTTDQGKSITEIIYSDLQEEAVDVVQEIIDKIYPPKKQEEKKNHE